MAKLVECVPNFSVSREKDPAVFQGLVGFLFGTDGTCLCDGENAPE